MGYALQVGVRYLRSKKRSTISVITVIAVGGVALGVGALLSVMAITGGFQDAFRTKILGVNAHVLVLKYGLDFSEYREVVEHSAAMPQVAGAAPFVIHEMMMAKGDRLSGVLVKGIDPEQTPTVLDLPKQMVRGNLQGLRLADARPANPKPPPPRSFFDPGGVDLDRFLLGLSEEETAPEPESAPAPEAEPEAQPKAVLPAVAVPTPEAMEAALAGLEDGPGLPDDDLELSLFADDEPGMEREEAASLPGVIVGATLAETLGLELGDHVRIISPMAGLDTSLWRSEGDGGGPRSRDFRVSGVFEAGFQEYDSRLVYVDLYEAQRFFEHGDSVTGVEIRLHDLEGAPRVAARLEADLGGAPYHTMDWQELNHNLFEALRMQKVMLSLVIGLITVVAAFNVIATLIMVVLEKKREIAILKAMGARDGGILQIFLIQGVLIGVIGTAIGLVLGGAVTGYLSVYSFPLDPKVYLIDHLPVRVSPMDFVYTVVIALVICTAATWIPSWWAARLMPADGVRYE